MNESQAGRGEPVINNTTGGPAFFNKPCVKGLYAKIEKTSLVKETSVIKESPIVNKDQVIIEKDGIHYVNQSALGLKNSMDREINNEFKNLVDSIISSESGD